MELGIIMNCAGIYGSVNSIGKTRIRLVHFAETNNVTGCIEKICENAINAGKVENTFELQHNSVLRAVNIPRGNSAVSYVTFSATGCTIRTAANGGGDLLATCVKSGTAGNYTFTWTDRNNNDYNPN